MQSLKEKFKNTNKVDNNLSTFSPEVLMDHLLSLCSAIEEETLVQPSCQNISIDEEGKVHTLQNETLDAYFMAPEVVFGKQEADKQSAWFSLGLLIYYIIFGRTYYEDKNILLVHLDERMKTSSSLIQDVHIPEFLNTPMKQLTSWKREDREKGVKTLLEAIKKYGCTVELQYMDQDKLIEKQQITFNQPVKMLMAHTPIHSSYCIEKDTQLTYRPGFHIYKVPVIQEENNIVKFLCIGSQELIKLDGREKRRSRFKVSREKEVEYEFYICTKDINTKTIVDNTLKFKLKVSKNEQYKESIVTLEYDPKKGLDLLVTDMSGKVQLAPSQHFEM